MLDDCHHQSSDYLTSLDQEDLDSKIGVSDTHDEDVISFVKLHVIIPQVANKSLYLFCQSLLLKIGNMRIGILFVM